LISERSTQPAMGRGTGASFRLTSEHERQRRLSLLISVLLSLAVTVGLAGRSPALAAGIGVHKYMGLRTSSRPSFGSLRLGFERNEGQTDSRARFLAHGPGYTLFLTADGAVLALQRVPRSSEQTGTHAPAAFSPRESVLRLTMIGANPQPRISGGHELAGKSNYFIGNNPSRWHTGVPTYAQVLYKDVYPGVDVVYYGRQGRLENDFIVAAGADPKEVRIRVEGAARVRLSGAGALVVETKSGEVELERPMAYQGRGRQKRRVAVRYVWLGHDEVGLETRGYLRSEPLIIDPVLSYSTYLGGTGGDMAYGIAVDSSGDAYVAGTTASTNFPVKSAVQSSSRGSSDVFVAELNPTGSALLYSTYIGGSGADSGQGIAVDASGDAYVAGTTSSGNFPVSTGAYQSTYGGGNSNAFVLKLGAEGSTLAYATYLGGNGSDFGQAIAIDGSGNSYVTGSTTSPNFPTQAPIQIGNDGCTTTSSGATTCTSDAFVTKLNSTGTALIYSTYWGGSSADSGQAIAVDPQGDCYVGGYTYSIDFPTQVPLQSANGGGIDGFITEFNPGGSAAIFSTYWGGSSNDQIFGLALDSAGSIYVVGETQSDNFPTAGNAYQATYGGNGDAFLSKFASPGANGSTVVYSTYLGGSQPDEANGIAVDSSGNVFVVGYTQSSDFPSLDPFQKLPGISGAGTCGTVATIVNSTSTTCADAFITKLNQSGQPVYSSYLGGSQNDVAQAVAVDPSGLPYIAGSTNSANFPVIVGATQSAFAGSGTSGNAFIAKVNPADAPGVAMTPQSVNFGNQTVGQASGAQTVTLINEGSAPLALTGITASGAFSQTNNCGTSLNASGDTCTINITFTPTKPGAVTDQIAISDNAAGSPQYITVTGNGTSGGAGALTITPSKLTFPSEPVGATSPGQTVQIVNASSASVTVTAITISGQFVETNTCGATPVVLNAGASCSAIIYFEPTSGGAQTGAFSLTSNGSGSPVVSLTGSGGALFSLSATSTSATITAGTTKTAFTVGATAPPTFTSSISLSCSSGVTCTLTPTSIKPGDTSTVTVTGLSATSSNPTNFTVTGTASGQTVTLALSIFFSDFSLSATPAIGQVTAGATTTYTVTANPLNGFNQVVLFSCYSGVPANTTCSWSPPGVALNGSGPASSTLTITTTSQVTTSRILRFPLALRPPGGGRTTGWILVACAGLLSLFFGLFAGYRKMPRNRLRRAYWLFVLLGLALLCISAVGCNNLYYQNNINPAPVGTPSGVYTLTLKGTMGSNPNVARTTTVNLSVGPSL
jgi:hypothetical protein